MNISIKYLFFILPLIFTFVTACNSQKNIDAGQDVTMIISAETKPCTGVGKMDCLLVKANKHQKDWTYFYSNIEGFQYQKGYEYVLKVKKTAIKHPPADGSSIRYVLVKMISKTKR